LATKRKTGIGDWPKTARTADACMLLRTLLKPVHTGDYSRRFRWQLSPKTATVAENCDCRRKVRLCRFRQQSHFSFATRSTP